LWPLLEDILSTLPAAVPSLQCLPLSLVVLPQLCVLLPQLCVLVPQVQHRKLWASTARLFNHPK
jgi:hypothetical protein